MEEKTVALSPDSAANANHQTQNKSSMDPPEVQANALGPGEGSGWTATGKEIVNKRGRGRPRKYEHGIPIINGSLEAFPLPTAAYCSTKRPRGRPKGTGKFQGLASFGEYMDTAGGSFTPHVLPVYKGEDLANTIVSFCGRASRSVCVLTASGAVSSVTLCAPGSSVGTLTYEGRFEILTLSGSSVVSGEPGTRRRTGLLSVSLANPHGRVFGGSVEGPLIAAGPGPIQLIVASFKQNIGREIRRKYCGGNSASAKIFASSEMANAPINQVSAMAEDREKCTSPPPVAVIMKADSLKSNTIVAENNNINPTSLQSIDPNNLQKAENLIAENHDFSSQKMAGSNNLQTSPVQQPVSDEMMIDNSGH
ncbi:hypothetical protein Golob_019592 [Gossypium lobatum]|uniref:AT-hook motif nuclear-localized protein n=1 Tax=Gossypium lobatum TaxID=34289 RepID=A0A7J8L7T0_9ROSI|nr:hypothetical protein [Gossypium lobatum]